jgi:hypothetical protein
MTDRDAPNRFNPERANRLPPELPAFLKEQQYAALLHATNLGTVLLVKSPSHEITSIRGRVPIAFNHELYAHPASPVIRILTRIYDQPSRPLALETFVNVGDPDQRTDYQALTSQDELHMLFYDERLRHALTKTTRGTDRAAVARVLATADRLLQAIPGDQRDFDAAKADVMAQSDL